MNVITNCMTGVNQSNKKEGQEGLPSFFTFYERNSQEKSDGEKGILYTF